MNIKNRFLLIVAIAALGLVSLAAIWLRSERSRILTERKQQAEHLVQSAFTAVARYHELEKDGQISGEEARRRALVVLRSMRYDGQNYFWVNNLEPRMIMHPIRRDLEGQRLKEPFFFEMVRAVESKGDGFVAYRWSRPGQSAGKPVDKLSYVKGFGPWGWVIGTGVYMDDVQAAWRESAIHAASIALVCLLALLLSARATFRSIFRRLSMVVERMQNAGQSTDGCTAICDIGSDKNDDEIAVLIRGFNQMLRAIEQRDRELICHGEQLEREVQARTAELSAAKTSLETAYTDLALFFESVPSILIGLDAEGRITRWNGAAANVFGVSAERAIGCTFADCGIVWRQPAMREEVAAWIASGAPRRCDDLTFERDGELRFLGLAIRPMESAGKPAGFLITGADVTQRKCLEDQLRQAHKLEAIGQLAAGVAHEINTPTQYVTDNTRFVKDSWISLKGLLALCHSLREEVAGTGSVSVSSLARFDMAAEECELEYLQSEIPNAIDQSLEGLARVAKIVRAMKEFAHPGANEKQFIDINRAIDSTIILSRGEWKLLAEVRTEFDPDLPLVPCLASEFNETILNLIVNAAHAIGDVVGNTGQKGEIVIGTRREGESVVVSIRDSGCGISEDIRGRVFDPFFTTKPVGKGSGQGLALAHALIVKKHRGQIWFETGPERGTTFFVRIPLSVNTSEPVPA